ncbi:MAG TPA: sigma-70 family RNA polymerase sigma factor [Polyangia bacterium]|jgi:RNA polymerase sigma-70 factor (ECF subfamily)
MRTNVAAEGLNQVRFTDREREFVYGVALKYVKDEEDARDVTQEALLLAYRYRASFRGDSRFTTWLYRIAATTALMHLRKRRRVPVIISSSGDETGATDTSDGRPSPEEVSATTEALKRAQRSLDKLGEKYANVFCLRFVDGYSEEEIAKKLGLNVATVKTRAYRARSYLRRRMRVAA